MLKNTIPVFDKFNLNFQLGGVHSLQLKSESGNSSLEISYGSNGNVILFTVEDSKNEPSEEMMLAGMYMMCQLQQINFPDAVLMEYDQDPVIAGLHFYLYKLCWNGSMFVGPVNLVLIEEDEALAIAEAGEYTESLVTLNMDTPGGGGII